MLPLSLKNWFLPLVFFPSATQVIRWISTSYSFSLQKIIHQATAEATRFTVSRKALICLSREVKSIYTYKFGISTRQIMSEKAENKRYKPASLFMLL